MIPYKQLSLADIFQDCQNKFDNDKPAFMRYGEIKRALDGVTHKMLSAKLKELESDELIIRHEYPGVPPKVEYYLSEKGLSLMPVLQTICQWGHEHINESQLHQVPDGQI